VSVLAELRDLLAKATPEPWFEDDRGSVIELGNKSDLVASIDTSYDIPFDREQCEADAALIVALRNHAEALVEIAEAVEVYLEASRATALTRSIVTRDAPMEGQERLADAVDVECAAYAALVAAFARLSSAAAEEATKR
jgi:hypothetical protein